MSGQEGNGRSRLSGRWGLVPALIVVVVVVAIGGTWYYRSEQFQVRTQVQDDLLTIEHLKVDEIARWRRERLADARVLSQAPIIREALVSNPQDGSPAITANSTAWLDYTRQAFSYDGLALLDADGGVRVSVGSFTSPADDALREAAVVAMASDTAVMTELHRSAPDAQIHITVVSPVHADQAGAPAEGVLAIQIDPESFLYPLIQSWPTSSRTAETLLVTRSDGDGAVFLNELRHVEGAALDLTIPPARTDVPAIMAIDGITGLVDGVDYRDVPVIAAIEPIPDSSWYMIAKVDEDEAFSGWRDRSRLILGVVTSIGLLAFASIGMAWQHARSSELEAILESERAQREGEARYQTTLLSVGDGVIVTDVQGKILLINPVAESLTGWQLEEARGLPAAEVFRTIAEEPHGELPDPVSEVLEGGRKVVIPADALLVARDGTTRPVADSSAPVKDAEGNVVGVVLVFRDQTEERRHRDEILDLNRTLEKRVEERTIELEAASQELKAANEELLSTNEELQCAAEEIAAVNEDLVEASEAKTRFLRSMSHELRTPLNSIIGFSDIMAQGLAGPVTDEQRRQLGMINHSGSHLLALINDILDLSRVEAGRLELSPEPFDVGSLARDVVASVSSAAESKGLSVDLDLHEGVDSLILHTDRRRVEQILLNLLSNAVKFTSSGGVKLLVGEPAQGLVSFSVQDSGPGISRMDQERIFGEFERVDSRDPAIEGTGLGLAISRGLAQALGGTLTVSSKLGHGATFTLILPLERVA